MKKTTKKKQVAGFIISHYRYGTGEGLTWLLHMAAYVSVAWYTQTSHIRTVGVRN